MIKLFNKYTRRDYLLHLIAGTYIYLLVCLLTSNNLLAMLSVILIGVGKELVYDKWLGRGTPEIEDAIITILGGVVILIYNLLI